MAHMIFLFTLKGFITGLVRIKAFLLNRNIHLLGIVYLSRVVRKPAFCICENKDADQLRGNREADQRLCFLYTDSTIPLFPKSKISSF